MLRSFRINRTAGPWLGLLLALSPLGCAKLNIAADVLFPAAVPGLPSEGTWASLPLGRWLTESGIEPVAISVCVGSTCPEPAVAGLFRARGSEALALTRAASDPAALTRALARSRFPGASKTRQRGTVAAEPAQEGSRPGFVVRLAGRGRAAGYVAAVPYGASTDILVIVAASEQHARRLAAGILPRLGR